MNTSELAIRIEAEYPQAKISEASGLLQVTVDAGQVRPFLLSAKTKLGLDYLMFVSAVDCMAANRVDVIYMLGAGDKAMIKLTAGLDRSNPAIATVSDLFRTADWHERETAEMFGIAFTGHPDPRKLLLPDEFKGNPLRKDFRDDFLQPLPTGKKEE